MEIRVFAGGCVRIDSDGNIRWNRPLIKLMIARGEIKKSKMTLK